MYLSTWVVFYYRIDSLHAMSGRAVLHFKCSDCVFRVQARDLFQYYWSYFQYLHAMSGGEVLYFEWSNCVFTVRGRDLFQYYWSDCVFTVRGRDLFQYHWSYFQCCMSRINL